MIAVALFSLIAATVDPQIAYGYSDLTSALAEAKLSPALSKIVAKQDRSLAKEAYRLVSDGKQVTVHYADPNGGMYGLFELAERVRNSGAAALKKGTVAGKPYLEDRGWNIFLPLPWDYAKNNNDPDPAALTDGARWFFHSDGYWYRLFNQMAHSRLNWLDIHGPYDLTTTRFPNLYAYFIQSDKFPNVGVAPEIKAKNLARLRWIIKKAHERGIRVSLMSYEARFDIPHNPNPGYKGAEEEVYDYTREVVAKMIRQVPELDKIGYRVGESGRGAEFFRCYGEAVKDSGREIPLYTRSWVTTKARVVPLARASKDFTVEIKYNGEQWGAPYIMQGGRTANWYSYFWEDYLSYSGPEGAKLWPGNLADSGYGIADPNADKKPGSKGTVTQSSIRYPEQPYKIVWQVRANGTHRIFPVYLPNWTRTSILSMKVGTASGFTIESMQSYFPLDAAYYRADGKRSGDAFLLERDELYMAAWGRLGYDPRTPDWKFDAMIVRTVGRERGKELAQQWRNSSKFVPLAYMAYSLGPDHRNHAPELEWGGDAEAFVQGEPFDSFRIKNIRESLAYEATGGVDGRLSLLNVARDLDTNATTIPKGGAEFEQGRLTDEQAALAEAWSTSSAMQFHLAKYYASRFREAYYKALSEAQGGNKETLRLAADNADRAVQMWTYLATGPGGQAYKPFTDRLRMGTHAYHWKNALPNVQADAKAIRDAAGAGVAADPVNEVSGLAPLKSNSLKVDLSADSVRVVVPAQGLKMAWLLEKPLPSSTFFHKSPMKKSGSAFIASFRREAWGHCIAAEAELATGQVGRVPMGYLQPYLNIPSLPKPTPNFYNSSEAMTYLDPKVLDPGKYGWMVVAQRGWNFHTGFSSRTKRKLLPAVERGMNLLVLQQDYASGRYPLDWLPVKPGITSRPSNVFDPGGALGLVKLETSEILWQPFSAAPGWEIFGNGGVARFKLGKGEIWMVQARFTQRMHIPAVAKAFLAILRNAAPEIGGQAAARGSQDAGANSSVVNRQSTIRKPAILIDTGTEGANYATSVVPDFMNAHDIPFLTLGEVIAREQGMNSSTPITGPLADDDVLEGKGPSIMKAFLEAKVKAAAARPLPKSVAEVEKRRPKDRKEFMRMMGLDPLPPRTPLNAKVTGTFRRPGYRVEKIVLESRPGFFVTGLLYVPEAPSLVLRSETEEGVGGGDKGAGSPSPTPPSFSAKAKNKEGAHQTSEKYPVILDVHGHWPVKKQTGVVQERCIFQALRGYVAFCIDTPGYSFEGDAAPIERRWQGQHNDWTLLLGSANTTALYAWDAMRALDYLETRPECDTTRVGITGASGGGLATVYTFVADERIKAAVPVVYATSLEVNPHNGCLCNHVPATLQVGDRSDLLAIRAPNPILVIGAQVDTEFPPEGTQKTGEKLRAIWKLFGKEDDAQWKVFPGGHDYNQPMQELAMGFFDKHLKGIGDGSPVPRPALKTEPDDSPETQVLGGKVPDGAISQRDIARQRLKETKPLATFEEVVKLNGGSPKPCNLDWKERDAGRSETDAPSTKRHVTYQSELGLTIPGVLWLTTTQPKAVVLLLSEAGKASAYREFEVGSLLKAGYQCFAMDMRGFGELQGLDQRLMTYLGTADALAMGWDAAKAAAHFVEQGRKVIVVGRGATGSQAALFCANFDPRLSGVIGLESLRVWEDAFEDGIPSHAVMPRADQAVPLGTLRGWLKMPATWQFRGRPGPNLPETIGQMIGPR